MKGRGMVRFRQEGYVEWLVVSLESSRKRQERRCGFASGVGWRQ